MIKSALRKTLAFSLPFLAFSFILFFVSHLSFYYSKAMGHIVSQMGFADMSIEGVSLSPFRGVTVKGVKLTDANGRLLEADQIVMEYSFADILKKKFLLKKVTVSQTKLNYYAREGPPSLSGLSQIVLGNAPKKQDGFEVILNQSVFCFHDLQINFGASADDTEKIVSLDFCVDGRGQKIGCSGKVNFEKSPLISTVLNPDVVPFRSMKFLLTLEPLGLDLAIDQVKLTSGKYEVSATGFIRDFKANPQFDLRLYTSPLRLEDFPSLRFLKTKGGEVGLLGSIKGQSNGLIFQGELIIPLIELTLDDEALTLEKVSSQFQYELAAQRLKLRELKGIFDGSLPFVISGEMSRFPEPLYNLRVLFKNRSQEKDSEVQSDVNISLQGELKKGGLQGDVSLSYDYLKDRKYIWRLKGVAIKPDANFKESKKSSVTAQAVNFQGTSVEKGEKKVQDFSFSNLEADMRFIGKKTFIDRLTMDGYGGKVFITGQTHFHENNRECFFAIKMDRLDLKDIKLSYPVESEMSGIVSGELTIKGKKGISVKGEVAADHYELKKLEPLDNVADFIGIASVKEISGAQVITNFDLSPQESLIKRFDIDSEAIRIRSDFKVNDKRWLEGEIAIGLPRKVLGESKIFKTLMSIARERQEFLDFVAHMSGFLWQLRIELVKSDLRDKLKEKISTGTQRYIENEANKAMEGQTE